MRFNNIKSMTSKKTSNQWKVLSSKSILNNPWINIKKDKVLLPSGKIVNDFYTVEGSNIVAILAINKDDNILLVKQYRHAVRNTTLDLPGGGINKGETPVRAARREFFEETGFKAKQFQELMTYYPDSGRKGDIKHIFLACGLFKGNRIDEANGLTDDVDHIWIPLKKVVYGIKKGTFNEATLQIAILYYLFFQYKSN